jgi:L-threonylcarbamoyladenylate synthase
LAKLERSRNRPQASAAMSAQPLSGEDGARLQACVSGGGVAVFPTDTVYGLGCDPENESAVRRLYDLKGRPADRPAAILFFALELALRALPELEGRERVAMQALLPGPVTLLLPNRARRFPVACGPDPGTLGLRVPLLGGPLQALGAVDLALLQSSANRSGAPDARRLADVPRMLRRGADMALDGGELPGVASTVLDLREYQRTGQWRVLRAGALAAEALGRALGDPSRVP